MDPDEIRRRIGEPFQFRPRRGDVDRLEFAAMMGVGSIDVRSSRCPWCDEPVVSNHGHEGLVRAENEHAKRCPRRISRVP